jgi:putative NADH-flavin reductase
VQSLETAINIIHAYKATLTCTYLLFVGGAGSLHVPNTTIACIDHPDFFFAYRRAVAILL